MSLCGSISKIFFCINDFTESPFHIHTPFMLLYPVTCLVNLDADGMKNTKPTQGSEHTTLFPKLTTVVKQIQNCHNNNACPMSTLKKGLRREFMPGLIETS